MEDRVRNVASLFSIVFRQRKHLKCTWHDGKRLVASFSREFVQTNDLNLTEAQFGVAVGVFAAGYIRCAVCSHAVATRCV